MEMSLFYLFFKLTFCYIYRIKLPNTVNNYLHIVVNLVDDKVHIIV